MQTNQIGRDDDLIASLVHLGLNLDFFGVYAERSQLLSQHRPEVGPERRNAIERQSGGRASNHTQIETEILTRPIDFLAQRDTLHLYHVLSGRNDSSGSEIQAKPSHAHSLPIRALTMAWSRPTAFRTYDRSRLDGRSICPGVSDDARQRAE
ncbi:MAG: hypothetical protein ITG02_10480 [Patulibacter sp.]|nr:hypothetical protein [Patulibacter sp.]